MTHLLLAVIYLAFIALGLPDSLLGNGWPVMHQDFHVPLSYAGIVSVIIALGYSKFYIELPLPNGSIGQLLDLMDYISNSFMMPFISMLSAILIGWVVGPDWIVEEVEYGGRKFGLKGLYRVMIKYVVPVVMLILFLTSTGLWNRIA